MTSPTDRITAVVAQHEYLASTRCCACYFSRQSMPMNADEWHAHLAERITAELQPEQNRQLAEAWQAGYNEAKRR